MSSPYSTPSLLHRIWVGEKPISRANEEYWAQFAVLNPGWEMRTWRDQDIAEFELARFYTECKSPAEIADLARIEILWRCGGVYVDADMEPIKSFEPLRQYRLALARVPSGLLANAVIVAEPHNEGLRGLMDTWLCWPHLPDVSASFRTGPYPVTLALSSRPELTVLQQEVFFPWMWGDLVGHPKEITLACHHWDKTWWPAWKLAVDRLSRSGHLLLNKVTRALPEKLRN